jgi:hypothetical protein
MEEEEKRAKEFVTPLNSQRPTPNAQVRFWELGIGSWELIYSASPVVGESPGILRNISDRTGRMNEKR